MMRHLMALLLLTLLALPVPGSAQDTAAPPPDRSATGGAQTLEDILARQRGEKVDDSFRRDATGDPDSAAGIASQLGTLGGASDSEVWRALRYGNADVSVSAGGDVAKVLVQDGGMAWYEFRSGPLATYGGGLLIVTIVGLLLFYLLRGKITLDEDMTGRTVTRFKSVERFAHWLLAGSFILLGLTGLFVKYGRDYIAPYLGKDVNAQLLTWSKLVHNNIAWAFIVALVMIFVMWVWHNIPDRTDLRWFAQAGGIIGHAHPPAKKFNGGQKIIFWSVILLGGSISVSGLSLLFPFELPLFAKTFTVLNDLGIPGLIGIAPLPTELAPQEEMQLAQAWHAIVSFVLMAIILAHIYIGSIGMEGAFAAMGSGEVDEAWAHQHHSLWLDELKEREAAEKGKAPESATPAE
ncbi:formate dehydrogenase subunit gamma [Thalassococcus sp. CAU 1522]|uniref:Formate dehydrogenase subunit gamma n=1 Tax=Thalassococcus arenae TaxID=2851652 RepID=A0ABS6N5X9_9RHOB|nr:formate dehydrogenase subunit gamma [Thalassococcus arenae]MBV2359427.1 formate dehydrogenase subunit gamma [Thalassococcus arenae]